MLRRIFQRIGALQIARQLHQNAVQHFTDLLGERGVNTDPVALSAHNTDWTRVYQGDARVVLSPSCTKEVSGVLAYCNEHNIGIVPQGGNTGLVGGGIAFSRDEVILSLSRMNKILGFHGVWLPIHIPDAHAKSVRTPEALANALNPCMAGFVCCSSQNGLRRGTFLLHMKLITLFKTCCQLHAMKAFVITMSSDAGCCRGREWLHFGGFRQLCCRTRFPHASRSRSEGQLPDWGQHSHKCWWTPLLAVR
jgi:hypothetical protein